MSYCSHVWWQKEKEDRARANKRAIKSQTAGLQGPCQQDLICHLAVLSQLCVWGKVALVNSFLFLYDTLPGTNFNGCIRFYEWRLLSGSCHPRTWRCQSPFAESLFILPFHNFFPSVLDQSSTVLREARPFPCT